MSLNQLLHLAAPVNPTLRRLAKPLALRLIRYTGQFDLTWQRLSRLKKRGLRIECALDIGVSEGEWASSFRDNFPDARLICVEARHEALRKLELRARKLSNTEVVVALLAEADGELEFSQFGDQSSLMRNSLGERFGNSIRMQGRRLDSLMEELEEGRGRSVSPDFLKLDVQGAEIKCLEGGPRTLEKCQAVLVEVWFVPNYADAPSAPQVFSYLEGRGFQLFDLLSLWHRPLNDDLAFGDALFFRKGHPILSDPRWSKNAGWERTT